MTLYLIRHENMEPRVDIDFFWNPSMCKSEERESIMLPVEVTT